MKKIVCLLCAITMMMSGCGAGESVKSEEEIRAEIKAEMEAEEKLKAELKAELEAEMKAESTQVTGELVDVKDKAAVWAFVQSKYEIGVEMKAEELDYYYGDFNKDDIEDVAVYSNDCNGFYEMVFIEPTQEGYKLIASEELRGKYGHSVELSGDFILYHYYTGGTGMMMKGITIYQFHEGKIAYTQASLLTEETVSIPPMEGLPDGKTVETTGIFNPMSNDEWSEFEHIVTVNETDHGTEETITEVTKAIYKYQASTNSYQSSLDIKTEESQAQDAITYKIEELKKGLRVSDKFTVNKDSLGTSTNEMLDYSFFLDCNADVKATLSFDDSWGFDLYSIYIQEPIIDKPLAITKYDTMDLTEGGIYGIEFKDSVIAEEFISFVKENPEHSLEGTVYVKSFEYTENEMESSWKLIVSDFRPSTSEMDRLKAFNNKSESKATIDTNDGSLSRFKNESLYSEDEPITIDYSQQHIVVVPMQTSVNESALKARSVKLTNTGYETPLKFAVLGEAMMIKFTYQENALDENSKEIETIIEEPIKDESITVYASLPTDFSYVGVEVMYQYYNGIEGFEFGLDDMRDPESHKILMMEKGEWPDEDY